MPMYPDTALKSHEIDEKVTKFSSLTELDQDAVVIQSAIGYRSRGQKNPRDLPKLFFFSHPNELELFLPKAWNLVNMYVDAALFYEKKALLWEELKGWLNNIQLIVIAVTARLLIREREHLVEILRWADGSEVHVPVLPIMFDNGIEEEYKTCFGDIQYFVPENTDPTAISYEKKLERFLKGTLFDDHLVERVRNAFSARIFMSYRRKDRAYAQELMRLIHKSDELEDVAIWYDEYLVFGKNFKGTITDAIDKSDMFTLVVTRSVLERSHGKPNFIMEYEYPYAKQRGGPILPIRMQAMKDDELKGLEVEYEGIGESVDGRDQDALKKAIFSCLPGKSGKECMLSKSEHKYLVGLAYLNRIDMEADDQRALTLITEAAESDNEGAVRALVSMFHNGKGVKRDYSRSIEWRERLVSLIRKRWEEEKNWDTGRILVHELWDLGDEYQRIGKIETAKLCYEEMRKIAKLNYAINRVGLRDISVSYEKLGDIELLLWNPNGARLNHTESLRLSKELCEKTGTMEAKRDVSVCLDKLGDIEFRFGKPKKAEEAYEESLLIRKDLYERTGTTEAKRDVSQSLIRLGDTKKLLKKTKAAMSDYEESLLIRKELLEEEETVESERDLSVSYERMGDIELDFGHTDSARSYYEESLRIRKSVLGKTDTVEAKRDLSVGYERLGDIEIRLGNSQRAKELYEESFCLRKELFDKMGTVESRRDMSVIYEKQGDSCLHLGDVEGAKKNYEKSLLLSEELFEATRTVAAKKDLAVSYERLGDIESRLGNLEKAKIYYMEDVRLSMELYEETRTLEAKQDASVSFDKLADVELRLGKHVDARAAYSESLRLIRELYEELGTLDTKRNMSVIINKLGDISMDLGDLEGAKAKYEEDRRICKELYDEIGTEEAERDLAVSFNDAGDAEMLLGNLEQARENYEEAMRLCRDLYDRTGSLKAKLDLSVCLNNISDIALRSGNLQEAKMRCVEALQLRKELYNETGTVEANNNLAVSYYKMGCLGDSSCYKKAYDIWTELAELYPQVLEYTRRRNILAEMMEVNI